MPDRTTTPPRPADVIYDVAAHLAAALERVPATGATDRVLAELPPDAVADTLLPVLGALITAVQEPEDTVEETANFWAAEVADAAAGGLAESSFDAMLWRAALLDVATGPPDPDARETVADMLGSEAQLSLAAVLLAGELAASIGAYRGADPLDVFFDAGQQALAGPLAA